MPFLSLPRSTMTVMDSVLKTHCFLITRKCFTQAGSVLSWGMLRVGSSCLASNPGLRCLNNVSVSSTVRTPELYPPPAPTAGLGWAHCSHSHKHLWGILREQTLQRLLWGRPRCWSQKDMGQPMRNCKFRQTIHIYCLSFITCKIGIVMDSHGRWSATVSVKPWIVMIIVKCHIGATVGC